jgi:hypothetical protein
LSEVSPGRYLLKFSTGRVIWEGDLTGRDLIWSLAFPGQPLELAAHTGKHDKTPSLTVTLLDGDIILHVFPGIRAGLLQIQVCREE